MAVEQTNSPNCRNTDLHPSLDQNYVWFYSLRSFFKVHLLYCEYLVSLIDRDKSFKKI